MIKGYLSLGTNLGDRSDNLNKALSFLSDYGIEILKISSVYETRPVEVPLPQPYYLNMAVVIKTGLSPQYLLDVCKKVEDMLGRKRPYLNAPRTIDIDILFLEGITLNTPNLTLPHPRLESRSFTIYPLSEIAPDLVLPSGKNIEDVKKNLGRDDIVAIWKAKDERFRDQEEKGYNC